MEVCDYRPHVGGGAQLQPYPQLERQWKLARTSLASITRSVATISAAGAAMEAGTGTMILFNAEELQPYPQLERQWKCSSLYQSTKMAWLQPYPQLERQWKFGDRLTLIPGAICCNHIRSWSGNGSFPLPEWHRRASALQQYPQL